MNHGSGLELSSLPLSLQEHVNRELRPGETIGWLGQPGRPAPIYFLFGVASCAVVMGFIVGLIAAWLGSAHYFWTGAGAIVFFLIVGFQSIPWTKTKCRYTAYVITNRRAVVVEQSIWFFPTLALNRFKVLSYGPEKLINVTQRNYGGGFGDLVFETRRHAGGDGGDFTEDFGFLHIADIDQVASLLRKLTGAQCAVLPSPEAIAGKISLGNLKPPPYLADPPRPVPFSIQWQLFSGTGWTAMLLVGSLFVAVSLVFIIPPFFAPDGGPRDGTYYLWRLFPCIHLCVGLGLLAAPIISWRRRVAILRRGLLAPARIVAYQDANLAGPWIPFVPATFAKAKLFSDATLPAYVTHQTDQDGTPGNGVLNGIKLSIGCLLGFFGLFGFLFGAAWIALVWLDQNAPQNAAWDKLVQTLLAIGCTGAYMGIAFFMWRTISSKLRLFSGQATASDIHKLPAANFRFVFARPEGEQTQAMAKVDPRSWRTNGKSASEDVAIYLPENPERALLLGGIWPPIAVGNGSWKKTYPPEESTQEAL